MKRKKEKDNLLKKKSELINKMNEMNQVIQYYDKKIKQKIRN